MKRNRRISEGSCWNCKKKRIRCNLGKPSCLKCQESGQECSYGAPPLKWIGGMALRGRNAPSSQLAHRPEVICTALSASASASAETSFLPRPASLLARRRDPTSLPPTPSVMPLDSSSLFKYYSTVVLPRFQVLEECMPVELHHAREEQPLQQVILAVARAHHSFLSKSSLGGTVMVRSTARLAAINSFRKQLEQGSDRAAQDLFTVNVLLCILDGMIEPERELKASMFHLKGGFAMLNRWPNTVSTMLQERGFRAHLLSVFATMDLLHAVLSGNDPYFDSTIWCRFADVQAWWGKLDAENMFFQILGAHSQIALLGHVLHTGGDPSMVEHCLTSVESLLLTPSQSGETEWEKFCQFYAISGSIYFHRVLRQRPIEDEVVQSLVRCGVALLVSELLPGMMSHCVIFPMLVIGSHCINDQDRQVVRDSLSPSLSYLSFGNMPVMADFLRVTWKKHDMQANWFEMFQDIADKMFLF